MIEQTQLEKGVTVIRKVVKTLPNLPGVYRMIDEAEKVLYVGKAKALKKRVPSYTRPDALPLRLQRMISRTVRMEVIVTHTEAEALLLETNMIKELSPQFNVLLKDGKSFPYIFVGGDHDYPRLRKHRGKQKEKGHYYGPFPSANNVNQTLITLQRVFQLRNCSDSDFDNRSRPCLQYHIKRCTAPCVDYVTPEEYAQQVSDANAFLSGKAGVVQKSLSRQMHQASDEMNYERAGALRDRIQALSAIQAQQDINIRGVRDADIFAIAQNEGSSIGQSGAQSAIQVFFYRNGQNFGNAVFFPTHGSDQDKSDILESFILQFYERYPLVPQILVSDALPQSALVEEIFSQKLDQKVTIRFPQRGDLRRLMTRISDNAVQALQRKQLALTTEMKAYKALAQALKMSNAPHRVEIYDNSHTAGQGAIGAMVVAGPEGFRKTAYRKFNIKQADPQDDVAMMREVMRRRFGRALAEKEKGNTENWPDLIIIDGGKGQYHAVLDELSQLKLDGAVEVLSIAKGEEREAGRERLFHPNFATDFMLPPDDPALHLLQRLRDEAHRFAIGTHRKKRDKAMIQSGLDAVPGVGPKRKKLLLAHFGSVKAVEGAALDDLCLVEGISKATAEVIYNYFHVNS